MKLREIGEFGLIERFAARVHPAAGVHLGIGDDAAVTEPTAGTLTLTTSDMLVEGVHFDLAYSDPLTLGRKSLAVNLSDIAAMGGVPRHFLLALAIPQELEVEFLDGFMAGLLAQAERFGVSLIGGDTCASPAGLVISITLMGEQAGKRVVTRRGARPGDLVCVTGTLGDAALGLALLKRGERAGEPVSRHLAPEPRVREGAALAAAGLPTAMIDISDGVAADLGHILTQSAVGARLELERLPLSAAYRAGWPAVAADPFALPLTGGEDYELLFTIPPDRLSALLSLQGELAAPVTVIGEITAGSALRVVDPAGRDYGFAAGGYNHFRA